MDKNIKWQKAVRWYNDIMFAICMEYNTIGTSYTEDAESRNQWNLRDLVSEMQYTLDKYKDPDCIYWEDAHSEFQPSGRPWYKEWAKVCARMQRFIDKYKHEAMGMACRDRHFSKFDN